MTPVLPWVSPWHLCTIFPNGGNSLPCTRGLEKCGEEMPLVKGRWAVGESLCTASLQAQRGAAGALDLQYHPHRLRQWC